MRILFATLLLVLVGCAKRFGPPVHYVVPDGYRGVFTIELDPNGGQMVPVTNGEFVVSIPSNGKLSVSSFDFIKGRHMETAEYASGAALSLGHSPTNIALRLVAVSPDLKRAIYVVGTKDEQEVEFKKYWTQ